MATIKERTIQVHGKTGMIETRGPKSSLYLHWYDGALSSYYEIRRGLSTGHAILKLTVARGTGPWKGRS